MTVYCLEELWYIFLAEGPLSLAPFGAVNPDTIYEMPRTGVAAPTRFIHGE